MGDPALGHYRPWLEDIRKEKPYQLEDRVEELFHEKSVTGAGAWNRLFDETLGAAALQGRRQAARDRGDAEPDAGRRRQEAPGRVRGARADLQGEPAHLRADHQHARQGQGDFRPLARLQGHRRRAASVQPGRAGGGRGAGRGGARRLSAPVASLLRAQGAMVRQEAARRIGTATRRCRRSSSAPIGWGEARDTVLGAYAAFSPRMADVAERFFARNWIDAPTRPGKQPGAFAHPTVPSAHPYVLLNYQGKPRDVMTLAHELGHGVHQVLAGAERRPDGADAADARRDRERVRRDAHLQGAARQDRRREAAPRHARRQGRGHDQHGGAADRVLQLRAQGPHRAAQRRAHGATACARSG